METVIEFVDSPNFLINVETKKLIPDTEGDNFPNSKFVYTVRYDDKTTLYDLINENQGKKIFIYHQLPWDIYSNQIRAFII